MSVLPRGVVKMAVSHVACNSRYVFVHWIVAFPDSSFAVSC